MAERFAAPYDVRMEEHLPVGDPGARRPCSPPLTIDRQQLADLPHRQAAPLVRYAAAIGSQRSESDSSTISMREQDVRALAAIYDVTPDGLRQQFLGWGILSS